MGKNSHEALVCQNSHREPSEEENPPLPKGGPEMTANDCVSERSLCILMLLSIFDEFSLLIYRTVLKQALTISTLQMMKKGSERLTFSDQSS